MSALRTVLQVGLPLTRQNNLAEGPLLEQLGHLRWEHLSGELGIPTRDLVDQGGARVCPVVFFVDVVFPEGLAMSSFVENDRIEIVSTLKRYETFLDGEMYLFPQTWPDERKAIPESQDAAADRGIPVVRMGNSFVVPFRGAQWLKKAMPVAPRLALLPETAGPEYVSELVTAKKEGRFFDVSGDFAPVTEGEIEVGYRIVPERDMNGVGLLYFANYPVIADVCERSALTGVLGDTERASEWMAARTLLRRRSGYFGNANARDTLKVGVRAWVKMEVQGEDRCDRLVVHTRIHRESDGRLLYVSSAIKRVTQSTRALADWLTHRSPSGAGSMAPPSAANGESLERTIGIVSELQTIWADALNRPDVDADASLFLDLGAGSLELMHVAIEIERRFGVDIAPASLLTASTVVAQADLVGRALSASLGRRVFATLARGPGKAPFSGKAPFFLVHGADGHPYNYLRLVRRMDPARPVHALVSPSLDPSAPFRTTPELLAEYRNALLRLHPSGPFVLGGWSYGGVAAYDLARLLVDAGREVSRLVVFDTTPPPFPGDPPFYANHDDLPLTFRFIWNVTERTDREDLLGLARSVLRGDADGLRALENAPPHDFAPLEVLADRAQRLDGLTFRQTFLPGQPAASLHRAALVFKTNLLDSVVPRDRWLFPGAIVVFACARNELVAGWQKRTACPVEVREYAFEALAGKDPHSSMMDDANVDRFVGDLCRTLDE
jgi:probable biosynthetic protein (TIGR04098 family)